MQSARPGSAVGADGALVAGVIDGTPAQQEGLAAGDTITALEGVAVDSADALSELLTGHEPGDRVAVTWMSGTTGASRTTTETLIAGPAD